MLALDTLLGVVDKTPLISIDLVVTRPDGRLLVGRRRNEPAKDSWFVPGGRINKDETLDAAFSRIATVELGPGDWNRADARLLGVFEHFYETNFAEEFGVTTHYIVLAYHLDSETGLAEAAPRDQHSRHEWVDADGRDPEGVPLPIHQNTTAYFDYIDTTPDDEPYMTDEQYRIANARRDSFNSLLWQAPVLTLTGLAFVFTIILGTNSTFSRWTAALMAIVISFVALQLMAKHRMHEQALAMRLTDYEKATEWPTLNAKGEPTNWLTEISSVTLWKAVYVFFVLAALVGAIVLAD